MRKTFVIFCFAIMPCLSMAQRQMDAELLFLVKTVCELRNADESTYRRVHDKLNADKAWTPMNETGSVKDGECRPYDKVPGFKLNRLLSQIASERKGVSVHGDMLNGNDKRYNYSLYERSVHAGAAVDYQLKYREKIQWLVIVPYYSDGAGLSASVCIEGQEPVLFNNMKDGCLVAFLDCPELSENQLLTISVKGGSRDQSFVLLNHNTREK